MYLANLARVVPAALDSPHGRDYASYHYAAKAVLAGADPYDASVLDNLARSEQTRSKVYPYLYPPPFLLLVAPLTSLPLGTAYLVWFGINATLFAAMAASLAWSWRQLGGVASASALLVGAVGTTVGNNHLMGQANVVVLGLTLLALLLVERRAWAGGALLGLAVGLKPSPAVVGVIWAAERRWIALTGAAASGVMLAALSLILGPQPWITFVVDVAPTFASGDYNGLGLPVGMFGNHGFPAFWHGVLPSGGRTLSLAARIAAGASSAALGGLLLAAWWKPTSDPWARWARWTGVLVAGLLVPVFSYEHHLVFAWPGVALACAAVATGRLSARWAVPVALAAVLWAFDLADLRALGKATGLVWLLGSWKFGSLLALTGALARLGR